MDVQAFLLKPAALHRPANLIRDHPASHKEIFSVQYTKIVFVDTNRFFENLNVKQHLHLPSCHIFRAYIHGQTHPTEPRHELSVYLDI